MSEKKDQEFAFKIIGAIQEVLNNEESDFHISTEDIAENTNDFFHALSNLAPVYLFNGLTGNEYDILQFNHAMNKLIQQQRIKELEKDSEQAKQSLLKPLQRLVELKHYKDENGKDDHNNECKDSAWIDAEESLFNNINKSK